jgi:hypothetical protein
VSPPNHQEVALERRDGRFFSRALSDDLEPRVVVTRHASERASHRFPDLRRPAIANEVVDALAEGRMRRTRPRWLGSSRRHSYPDTRYVWPPGRRRAYVVRFAEEGVVVVVTVLHPWAEPTCLVAA